MTTGGWRLRSTVAVGATLALMAMAGMPTTSASALVPQALLPADAIPKFVEPMPQFGPNGLPRVDGAVDGADVTVRMEEFKQQVLPDSFPKTWVWGYEVGDRQPMWPGVTIEAEKGTPTEVTYINNLPSFMDGGVVQGLITYDQTIHWADPLEYGCFIDPDDPLVPDVECYAPYTDTVPAVSHLHGAEVKSDFDGGPDQWFTPTGEIGPAYSSVGALYPTGFPVEPGKAVYRYANGQEATSLWFHDHALGITRLNVYGGLAAFYLLRDDRDTGKVSNPVDLPGGPFEKEVLIQDRMFDQQGQLLFPDGSSDASQIGPPPNPDVHPFWIPEFLGNAIAVNGKTWPYMDVKPRRYRLRLLNGSNARFYKMFLEDEASGQPGPAFWQIGTDGGLLDKPVQLNDPTATDPRRLLLAPGERADIIVDFSGYQGQTLTLRNTAATPFPGGVPVDPDSTGQIMQFRVGEGDIDDNTCDPSLPQGGANACDLREDPIVRLVNPKSGKLDPDVTADLTRQLTLNETEGAGGPIELLLNNTKWSGTVHGVPGEPIADSVFLYGDETVGKDTYATELPRVGSTEVWEIINISADAHPIHLHLIQFQVLNRQRIDEQGYIEAYADAFPDDTVDDAAGPPNDYSTLNADDAIGGNPAVSPYLLGKPRPPKPNEAGWKDTVVMMPGEVTRIAVRWAQQDVPVDDVSAGKNTFPFDPIGPPGYVWHCHILDHEDNEMMRPYEVQP